MVDLGGVFATISTQPGIEVLVLEVDGGVVATTHLDVIPNLTRSLRPCAVVENVVVDEARRDEGLGKQVMAGPLERAWALGCDKAMLQTGSRREATHAVRRACGFAADDKDRLRRSPVALNRNWAGRSRPGQTTSTRIAW